MKLLYSVVLTIIICNCNAQLRRVFNEDTGKFGYVNDKKVMVIPPRFGGAAEFSEGLAAVFIDSAWGYIDTTGSIRIRPVFASAESFRHGLAAVGVYKSTSPSGESEESEVDWCKVHLEPQWTGSYYERRNFNENCVMCPDCFIGIINKKGEYIIEPQYKSASVIKPNVFKVGKADCWGDLGAECYYGLVNDKNEGLIKCNFEFSDIVYVTNDLQYFMVQKGFDEYPLKAVIDKDCNTIIPFKYYHLAFGPVIDHDNPITVGLGTLPDGEGEMKLTYVFINLKQEQVIKGGFEYASFFLRGVAEVYTQGNAYCIKKDGLLLNYCEDCECYR